MHKKLIRLVTKVRNKVNFYLYVKKNNIRVAAGSSIAPDVKIGRYTRINAKSHLGTCEIGSFCAIAGRLIVRSSDHYTNYLNMQDFFQHSVLGSKIAVAGKSKGEVRIGNSVWIGDSVIILSGVTIGNGAVIGAGSVVTKSVPAYAIAVGSPAKVIKYRFDQNTIDAIEEISWWDWSMEKIKKNKHLFEKDLASLSQAELKELLRSI